MRYYACECMYNVAKVSKGELLRFFNSIFEAQCKVKDTRIHVIVHNSNNNNIHYYILAIHQQGAFYQEWSRHIGSIGQGDSF